MGISQRTSEDPARGGPRGLVAALLGIALLGGLVSRVHYLVDDAFITFRYARNWAEWGQPVFNSFELVDSAEKVEGYSNFAWMAILAVCHGAGLALEGVAPALELVIGAATVALLTLRGPRVADLGPRAPWIVAVLLGTMAPFVAWTTGGMETGLQGLLVSAWFLGLLGVFRGAPGARRGWSLGLVGAALVLVRIEGLAWALGLVGAVLAAEFAAGSSGRQGIRDRKKELIQALLVVLIAFGAQLFFRVLTYGTWTPNTVAAKTGGAGIEVWTRGARQLGTWAAISITPIAALLALPFALRHRSRQARTATLASLFALLGFSAYNVATGGDWMPFFRFLAPASSILVLLVAIGLDAMGGLLAFTCAMALAALQPLPLFDVHVAPLSLRSALRFRAFRGGYRTERASIDTARKNAEYFGNLGKGLALATAPSEVLAFGAIGSPGWYAKELDFVDRNGLVTPSVSRREVALGSGTAGHEKRVPHAWFLDHGDPRPKYLFAKVIEGDLGARPEASLVSLMRQDFVIGRPEEAELFQRTVLRTVPFAVEEPEKGGVKVRKTLLLLERASPEEANRFWSR